jgi:hypothetical protein
LTVYFRDLKYKLRNNKWKQSALLLVILMHVPNEVRVQELGLELVSLEDKSSRMPKRPLMAREKKDDGTRDPFKMLLEEALTQQRNEMMDSFTQILWRQPKSDASSSSGGVAPFKVQINFNIPIFEG